MSTTGESAPVEIKRGVRLVKKVKKDKKVEKVEKTEKKAAERNGEANNNAEITVKLPSKPSGTKTETEVNVLKKILSDGTVEELKTTTTKTTIDGKTETAVKTETRKLPKEEANVAIETVKNEAHKSENGITESEDANDNTEAELIVKLPSKKTGAKTETKVEIANNILSDGSVEEVKTTTTKTTIDGKTDIKTQVDKRILSKEEADSVVETVEEEEEEVTEEENNELQNVSDNKEIEEIELQSTNEEEEEEENKAVTIVNEESEVTETKKVIVSETSKTQDSEEEEEIEEEHEEKIEIQKNKQESVDEEEEEEEDVEVTNEKEEIRPNKEESKVEVFEDSEEEVVEEETEEQEEVEKKVIEDTENEVEIEGEKDEEEEEIDKEDEEIEVEDEKTESSQEQHPKADLGEVTIEKEDIRTTNTNIDETGKSVRHIRVEEETIRTELAQEYLQKKPEDSISLSKPTVPLEKVEDIEIKPIGLTNETITKSQMDKTEITLGSGRGTSPHSTETQFNRYENIVSVNRTTKTLDRAYEQITQHGVPTMKTYFAPGRDKVAPAPVKPYQPIYNTDTTTERRHSLLLERLSSERQLPPTDVYQNNYPYNSNVDQQNFYLQQEPQSEVLTVSNVKPSTITNQQWYQQTKKDHVIQNNAASTPSAIAQNWNQSPLQPQYQIDSKPPIQPQYQYQPSYTENVTQDYSRTISNNYQQSSHPSYASKPTNWGNSNTEPIPFNQNVIPDTKPINDYKPSQTYSSTYVPPPWEQDLNYSVNDSKQNYYQAPPVNNTYNPVSTSWKPPPSKFSKPTPTAYIPPAPNKSFVKTTNVDSMPPPKIPGRKTYYSEYERRYISVPETTYVPGETKYQPQPDPSPKHFYDNNEQTDVVEHQWRKELREFTEKSAQSNYQDEPVRPPWEEDPKYAKEPQSAFKSTPTWSQTLRPRSWRERSFESEYVGPQGLPKTSTIGRGRPVSSYVPNKVEPSVSERPRGVSVDRYNPNNYQPPVASEHPPVQSHTLTPTNAPHAKSYHNPNIPAYHARASAEPREQPVTYQQPRMWGDARTSPIQSRSFKYLQWITGTDH